MEKNKKTVKTNATNAIIKKANIFKSVVLATFGSLFLTLMSVFAKLATEHYPETVIVFFRFAITGLYIFIMIGILRWKGVQVSLKTKHIGMHMLRATTSTISMYSLYYALRYIPLVEASVLMLTYPLFALILTRIFFKDQVSLFCWTAMAIGFAGIIFIVKPSYSLFLHPAMLIGLFSGICIAISILGIRELSKTEHTYTIMFYYTSVALITSVILVFFDWHTPDRRTLLLLLGVGVCGMLYQEFLTRALTYAPPRIPSSLMYLNIVFSSVFGLLVWHHMPDYLSWLGIILVCLGNILVVISK